MPPGKYVPRCPGIPRVPAPNKRTYTINLITPMFGGGVVAREIDESFPIRPTAIRGQLQFWVTVHGPRVNGNV
ncbi:MAG: hypothetical protein KatS3mg110_3883 [Pirellulaceae bacterium]|nr:MAG: hypothetical protein KatS3mg110_3883 [Pirellulaceae bacterium]